MNTPVKESTIFPDQTFPINLFFLENRKRLIHLHWHSHIEWIYVLQGKVRIQIDTAFTDVQKGDLIFVNPDQIHGATSLDDQSKIVAIVSNESLIRNSYLDSTEAKYIFPVLNREIRLPNFIHFSNPITNEIRTLIIGLIQEFVSKKTGFELLIKSNLYHIFGLMFRHFQEKLCDEQTVSHKQSVLSEEFRLFLEHLEHNYDRDISINEAAAMVNMSQSHFYRVFKKVTGKTLINYINHLRIYKAESLLQNTDLSISDIAEKIGYGSSTYFGRVFRMYKNVSPAAYRNLKRKS